LTIELGERVVLVTGASIGIGREIALRFAAERSRLALTYFEHRAEAEEVVARCLALGATDVLALPLDARDDDSIREVVEGVAGRFGAIDILVNNAGVVVWRPFLEQGFGEIEEQLLVNLHGVLKLTWSCLPHVRDAIITIGSGSALHGTATLAPYCAAKWGVRGFTKALALEHPEKRIYAVHPTRTATRMNDFHGDPPERVADVVLRVARGELDLEPGADVDVRAFREEGR
jgi:NAD(P)-dependent dehydrogenase (short-subunit alcohol dehydrogenase family)